MKKAPEIGSRWRLGSRTVVYEIVEPAEGRSPRDGYVNARMVSETTDEPIGGRVEVQIVSLGTTYKRVQKKKGEK
jgi:hypothetical protein